MLQSKNQKINKINLGGFILNGNTHEAQQLIESLVAFNNMLPTTFDLDLFLTILRTIRKEEAITTSQLGKILNLDEKKLERLLSMAGADFDNQGRLIGLGITRQPTPHRYVVDGEVFYTWCAPDTLIFPILLEETVQVESIDPKSKDKITATITPRGVRNVKPSSTVISWLPRLSESQLTEGKTIKSTTCIFGHYFANRENATRWVGEHVPPDRNSTILTLDEAFQAVLEFKKLLEKNER